jgi:hypothetical protein
MWNTPTSGQPVNAPNRRTEMAWAVIPAVVLAIVLAFTWRKLHEHPAHHHAPHVGASVISS